MVKRVCVLGAGTCGLCATKNLVEAGFTPVVLERRSEIGGLWVYTDQVGCDEFGLPMHSSLYKGLW
jgi:cation diffusion facilitator CzcD-associated flavoprotein CzcO